VRLGISGGNGIAIAAVYQLLSQVARTVNDHTRRIEQHLNLPPDA
jgi:hypothetical protein